MKKLRRLVTAIAGTTGLMFGSRAIAAPAANADTSDFHFTVTAKDFDHTEQSVTIENRKRLTINGAQQLTWENSNHGLTVTAAQIRSAPKIKTSCTESNRRTQSTQIFNKTHGARTVVVTAGCVWNRGMRDQYRVGFKFYVKSPMVLKVDSHHRYRHAFALKTKSQLQSGDTVTGKVVLYGITRYIVKVCLNYIGGAVNTYTSNPVQVRYAKDVKYSGELEVKSEVEADVTFNITCPNGANFSTQIHAAASGYARSEIRFTERTRVTVVNAKRVTLNDSSWLHAEQEAISKAELQITVSGSCGENPPPNDEAPSLDVNAVVCTTPGGVDDIISASGTNNDVDTRTLVFNLSGGPTSKPDIVRTTGAGSTETVQFTGLEPGSYIVKVTVQETGKSASKSVNLVACPPLVNDRPTGEIVQWPAHLEPSEYYRVKVVGSDPEDGGAVELIYSVSGGATIVTGDANHPTICDIEGTNRVCTFWIRANQSVGVEYEISLQVRDGSGLTSPVYTKTGMVQAMPV